MTILSAHAIVFEPRTYAPGAGEVLLSPGRYGVRGFDAECYIDLKQKGSAIGLDSNGKRTGWRLDPADLGIEIVAPSGVYLQYFVSVGGELRIVRLSTLPQ